MGWRPFFRWESKVKLFQNIMILAKDLDITFSKLSIDLIIMRQLLVKIYIKLGNNTTAHEVRQRARCHNVKGHVSDRLTLTWRWMVLRLDQIREPSLLKLIHFCNLVRLPFTWAHRLLWAAPPPYMAPDRMQAIVLVCKEHDLLAVGGEF